MNKANPNCPKTGTDSHASGCYRVNYPACGMTEHAHSYGPACYYVQGPREGQLKCTRTEHTHHRTGCAETVGPTCGGV